MKSTQDIINSIIMIGKSENYPKMEFVDSDHHLLWNHNEEFWKKICVNLRTEDIVSLLKSLVYSDGRFKKWSTYSAMYYCSYLLSIVQERFGGYNEEYYTLLNWIFENRMNTYIPYIGGNLPLGINSIVEYRRYSEAQEEKRKNREEEKKREYEEAQVRKKERKEEAIKRKARTVIEQLNRKNEREIFLTELRAKTKLEILRTILSDTKHSIYYYPEELSTIEEDIIVQMSSLEKQTLINKLNISHGSWRILRNKLKIA